MSSCVIPSPALHFKLSLAYSRGNQDFAWFLTFNKKKLTHNSLEVNRPYREQHGYQKVLQSTRKLQERSTSHGIIKMSQLRPFFSKHIRSLNSDILVLDEVSVQAFEGLGCRLLEDVRLRDLFIYFFVLEAPLHQTTFTLGNHL